MGSPAQASIFAMEPINPLYIFQMVPSGYRSAQEHMDLYIDGMCIYDVLGPLQEPTYPLLFPGN